MSRILTILLAACLVPGNAPKATAAASAAAAQVCADIMAQYGIAPEGCDPEQDAAREAATEKKTPTSVVNASTTVTSPSAIDPDQADSNVFFSKGGSELDAQARERLSLLAEVLETFPSGQACIRLVGHSDISGPEDLNTKVAQRRADAVATYLRQFLPQPSIIESVESAGESQPLSGIAPTDAWNRRVTIWARTCPQG